MNYNKLRNKIKLKKLSVGKVAEEIGMTEAGLYKSFNNDTLKVKDFENICDFLNVNPCVFFEEKETELPELKDMVAEDIIIYDRKTSKQKQKERVQYIVNNYDKVATENEYLKQQVKDRDEIINLLKQQK